MARFDKFMAEKNAAIQPNGDITPTKEESPQSPWPSQAASPIISDQSMKRISDDDELSDVPDTPSPKKRRKVDHYVDDDAAFAAKLQAEENSRARPTRNGMNRRTAPIKKKQRNPKKKTSDKVKAEDDSDVQDSCSEGTEKKVNRSGGFHVCKFLITSYYSTDQCAETNDTFRPSLRASRQ
jgi:upstream activation factor subunit UAF30